MRIIIIEDHLMFREVIRKICDRELRYDIIAESDSGLAGAALVAKHSPDILILDLALPELDGFSVIERVKRTSPKTKIVVVSGYLDDRTLLELDETRVQAFVDKNTNEVDALKAAITAVASGKSYFSPVFRAARRKRLADPSSLTKLLSDTEVKVLSLVGQGFSDQEIADRLKISPRTAQTHRSNIMQKLRLRGTPKLMMFAIERGFAGRTAPKNPLLDSH